MKKKIKWKRQRSNETKARHDWSKDGSRITHKMARNRLKLSATLKDYPFKEGDEINFDKAENLTWEEIDNIKDI